MKIVKFVWVILVMFVQKVVQELSLKMLQAVNARAVILFMGLIVLAAMLMGVKPVNRGICQQAQAAAPAVQDNTQQGMKSAVSVIMAIISQIQHKAAV